MSDDASESVNYEINTTANLQGQKAAAAGFKDLGNATKEAGEKAEEAGRKNEESGKKAEFLGLKTGELKKLTRELGHEFPIAGMAARAMLNPIVASITGAIAIFSSMKAKLEEWNKALDESAEKNASRDFLPGIQAEEQAMHEAAVSAGEFGAALANIGVAEDQMKAKTQAAIDKVRELSNAMTEINNAKEARDLAQVDLAQKTGKIGDVAAIEQRAAIRTKYRKMEDDQKTAAENKEIALKKQQLTAEQAATPGLQEGKEKAEKTYAETKGRTDRAKKDLEEGEKKQAEYEAEAKAKDAALSDDMATRDQMEAAGGFAGIGFGQRNQEKMKQDEDALNDAQARVDAQKKLNEKNRQLIKTNEEKKLPGQKEDVSTFEQMLRQNKSAIQELAGSLPKEEQSTTIKQQTRATVGQTKDETSLIEVIAELGAKLAEGQKREQEMAKQIKEHLASREGVTQAMLDAYNTLIANDKSTKAEIERLTKEVQSLQRTRSQTSPMAGN